MVYKCFDKKSFGEAVKSEIKNEEFAEKLHKPINRKFERQNPKNKKRNLADM